MFGDSRARSRPSEASPEGVALTATGRGRTLVKKKMGTNGTYLFELVDSTGWTGGAATYDSGFKRPITQPGRPQGVRPRSPSRLGWSSHLVPGPVSDSRSQLPGWPQGLGRREGLLHDHARYDVENRLVQAVLGGVESYGYGPDNKRVWRAKASGDTEFYFYGLTGERQGIYRVGVVNGFNGVKGFFRVTAESVIPRGMQADSH